MPVFWGNVSLVYDQGSCPLPSVACSCLSLLPALRVCTRLCHELPGELKPKTGLTKKKKRGKKKHALKRVLRLRSRARLGVGSLLLTAPSCWNSPSDALTCPARHKRSRSFQHVRHWNGVTLSWEVGSHWTFGSAGSKRSLGSDALDGLQISLSEYCVAGKRKQKKGRKQHWLLFSPFLFASSIPKHAKASCNAKDPKRRKDETSLGPTERISA